VKPLHFDDPAFVQRYAEGPGRFVPGYAVMQAMAAQAHVELFYAGLSWRGWVARD
jgi:hypothetical protein